MATVKRMLTGLRSRPDRAAPMIDSPEANVTRAIKQFCESGGPNNPDSANDEVLHLPVIVEAAESTPVAAREACTALRRYLNKDYISKPYVQYNTLMVLRILVDNPGRPFTKNIDKKFVDTIKETSRSTRDPSVRQLLTETLDYFESKEDDENLQALREMWKKEKPQNVLVPQPSMYANIDPRRVHRGHGNHPSVVPALPPPVELAGRISEAKMSAQLLTQVLQSTPAEEFRGNSLIKEFADRCRLASNSMQTFINSDNPSPDEDTIATLIETNEILQGALRQYKSAKVVAERAEYLQREESQKRLSDQPTVSGGEQPTFYPPEHQPAPVPTAAAPEESRNTSRSPPFAGSFFSRRDRSPNPPPLQNDPAPGPPPPKTSMFSRRKKTPQEQQAPVTSPFDDPAPVPVPPKMHGGQRPAPPPPDRRSTGGYGGNTPPQGWEPVSPVSPEAPAQRPQYRY